MFILFICDFTFLLADAEEAKEQTFSILRRKKGLQFYPSNPGWLSAFFGTTPKPGCFGSFKNYQAQESICLPRSPPDVQLFFVHTSIK